MPTARMTQRRPGRKGLTFCLGNHADIDTKCTPGSQVGVHFALPGVHFSEVGCICVGWVHLDKLEFVD